MIISKIQKQILKSQIINKNILKGIYNKRIYCFSTTNPPETKTENDITLETNPTEESELLIKVPKERATNYTLGQLNFLMLYENYSNLNRLTTFIPAPKFNLLIFSYLTYISYSTYMFQPSLCILFYSFNKILITGNRRLTEVLTMSILSNMTTILIKTMIQTRKIEISDTTLEKNFKVGKETYHIIRNKAVPENLYLSDNSRYANKELVMTLLSGKYTKARFVYI